MCLLSAVHSPTVHSPTFCTSVGPDQVCGGSALTSDFVKF
uniref:Uncharacterized protein n=1 Tax=Anguilla anguilla TaxID=7936 RepID=A0A0E9VMZ0_ANGAN